MIIHLCTCITIMALTAMALGIHGIKHIYLLKSKHWKMCSVGNERHDGDYIYPVPSYNSYVDNNKLLRKNTCTKAKRTKKRSKYNGYSKGLRS